MPIVNYVREHTRFIEYASDEKITASERLLWYALMHIMNQRAQGNVWPDEFIRVSNDRLLLLCPMKFDTMVSARNALKQRGLIEFIPGEKNKKSPQYRMVYFYPQYAPPRTELDGEAGYPQGYPKKSDYTGGNMGGNMGGNTGGNMGSNMGGNPGGSRGLYGIYDLNINGKREPDVNRGEEEDLTTDTECAREDPITLELSGDDGAGGKEPGPARNSPAGEAAGFYRPRAGFSSAAEKLRWQRLMQWLDANPRVKAMFGPGWLLAEAILGSDRFPAELVGHAIALTWERNGKYAEPLGSPVGYMQALLQDWEARGFRTIADIQEAKGDYDEYGVG